MATRHHAVAVTLLALAACTSITETERFKSKRRLSRRERTSSNGRPPAAMPAAPCRSQGRPRSSSASATRCRTTGSPTADERGPSTRTARAGGPSAGLPTGRSAGHGPAPCSRGSAPTAVGLPITRDPSGNPRPHPRGVRIHRVSDRRRGMTRRGPHHNDR